MQNSNKTKAEHLKWAVESRYENQRCAIRLLKLLTENEERIKKRKLDMLAQVLVGAAFSLWRAAFLADKSGMRAESYKAAISFLETMIADNAIGFAQDKREREWTFNYYVNNVRDTLLIWHLKKEYKHVVPKWIIAARSPTQRWKYAQKLLAQTVENFAAELETPGLLEQGSRSGSTESGG